MNDQNQGFPLKLFTFIVITQLANFFNNKIIEFIIFNMFSCSFFKSTLINLLRIIIEKNDF